MPTPIGHALGGIAAGYFVTGLFAGSRAFLKASVARTTCTKDNTVLVSVVTLACMGMLPDIDFLFAAHREFTHSIGATIAVMMVAAALTNGRLSLIHI